MCKGCNNPIYSWKAKFESGCGWPAFDKCFKNSIKTIHEIACMEIVCAKCDGHLGHVFRWDVSKKYKPEQYTSRTNQRHCVNSASIKYVDKSYPESWTETTLVENRT